MKLLVTGGAGFIGSHLSEALLEEGHEVRVLDNLSTGSIRNLDGFVEQVDFIEADLRDAAAVDRAVAKCDAVFHLAALGSVPRSMKDPHTTHDINATGSLHLYDAIRNHGVETLIIASSSSIYGDSEWEYKREDQPPNPISPYGASKLATESYGLAFANAFGFNAIALRYFNVFGPRQSPAGAYAAVIPKFISSGLQRQRWTINGDGKHSRDFTYVQNVVNANLLALRRAGSVQPIAMNAACAGSVSLLELSEAIQEFTGTEDIEPVLGPSRPGDIVRSRAAIELAQETIGYDVQVPWREGLKTTVDWFAANVTGEAGT